MLERYMEAPKKKSVRARPKASIRKKVKEVDPVRDEVASVLDGLVYLTESVAKLEGTPRKKGTSHSKGRPPASRRKVKVNEEDAHIRREVASVLDGLVYLTESVAKLESGRRGHRTKSVNSVYSQKNELKNSPKNYTRRILEIKRRARKSEGNVTKGIKNKGIKI